MIRFLSQGICGGNVVRQEWGFLPYGVVGRTARAHCGCGERRCDVLHKCGAQIPDGSMFCTICGARVGGVEDQAEPAAFPVEDAPSSAPVGRKLLRVPRFMYGGAASL
ncbi:MAG: zinc ribbon domain-containing protein [Collinsella sp.]